MSFFDDASLVFLPSGQAGKDGKAYSMKPTDGSGDFTFSRGSNLTSTRIDSNGLIEKGRENLLLQSNQFDTTWNNINITQTSGETGYDGSSDAWQSSFTAGSTRTFGQSFSQTGVITISIYVKAGTHDFIQFVTSTNIGAYVNFDISSSSAAKGTEGSGVIDSSIISVGSDWYRCSMSFNNTSSGTIYVWMINSATSSRASNVSTAGSIYIQDAQLEIGLTSTEYIESGASSGKAGILEDSPRFDYSGGASCGSLLLEGSRTNLVTQSEYLNGISWNAFINSSIDTNATTSPEGLTNASLLKENLLNDTHAVIDDFSLTSGSTYTISIFAKSNGVNRNLRLNDGGVGWGSGFTGKFDLTAGTATGGDIESMGNGWYRCSVTGTTNATTSRLIIYSTLGTATSYQGDGSSGVFLYGLQIEEGSLTSYIPNHSGGSVTREADVNTLLNQSGVIGQTTGTILFDAYFDEADKVNFSISDSSANNFISIETTSSNEVTAKVEQGGSTQATITTTTSFFAEGDRLKCAIAYDDRDMAFYINGTQVNTAVPNLIPACDDIRFGNYDGSIKADQRVNRVLLFTTRISNGNLATLTS